MLDLRVVAVDGTFVKANQHATGAHRGHLGQDASRELPAIGRTRGGVTTKVAALTDHAGRLARYALKPGNAAAVSVLPELLRDRDTEQVTELLADWA